MSRQDTLDSRPSPRPKLTLLLLRTLVVLLLSAPVIVLLLSIETSPSHVAEQQFSDEELSRIETLLLESAPQSPSNVSRHELQLNAEELNLLLRYAANIMNLSSDWAARTQLSQGKLNAQLSVRLSAGPLPLYLNVAADFIEDDNLLTLDALRIGRIGVPNGFLQFTLQRLRGNLATENIAYLDFSELINNIESIELDQNQMTVSLQWDPNLISRLGNQAQQLFISELDQQRIIDYYAIITNIAAAVPTNIRAVSINAFLSPLFAAAQEKTLAGSDPIAENRTAFQTLAIYLNEESIAQLIGEEAAAEIEPAPFIEARLQRRQDLAQHLVSIAAITASAGADLAQMLSTTKEAYDARYRSGFSFSDLTANSVGVSIARLATNDSETAKIMQGRLANLQNESDYMPEVGNNLDGLSETDFNAMYTDRNSPQYAERLAEIQALIDSRPLFSGLLQ
ncbi:MAG: hypothetical protein COB20_12730 [SAR86 cluster bacterium]|uniref:Uncharacterized protein n=1 Tax=SAR86 cluster bacterium TaxID=2030880 RepID=A0A2A4X097_9GAMM|nr:MAG: hypothetical protein COB20_12730 [SAR86 cluster bacterium]